MNAIEMVQDQAQEAFPGRGIGFKHRHAGGAHTLGYGLHGGGVEVLLATEVVVEQGLVDAGRLGNLLGARPGQAVLAELADGGRENARPCLVGAFGLGAGL